MGFRFCFLLIVSGLVADRITQNTFFGLVIMVAVFTTLYILSSSEEKGKPASKYLINCPPDIKKILDENPS